jgi:hypothetical protein
MKILVKKTQTGLRPIYESDFENYSKIEIGEEFEIEYTKKRNIKFHRKFFSLIKLAFENQQDYRSMERMRKKLIEVAGYYEEYRDPITKEICKEVHSISFAKMDDTEFELIYNGVKNVISDWLGINNETIDDEINQYF